MSHQEVLMRDWQRFLELKESEFNNLEILKWTERLKWQEPKPVDVPKYLFIRGELRSLRVSFYHLANHYCYAAAADAISKDCAHNDDKNGSDIWRFLISNYHFYNFPPGYKTFLDYASRFVAGLTLYKIYENSGRDLEWRQNWPKGKFNIYYGSEFLNVLNASLDVPDDFGEFRVSRDDRRDLLHFLAALDIKPVDDKFWDVLIDFRNKYIHEYAPGLGHFTKRIEPIFEVDPGTNNCTFTAAGFKEKPTPDYYFDELEPIAKQVILMIDHAFDFLLKTRIINSMLIEAPTIE